jgi:hypothetical protein
MTLPTPFQPPKTGFQPPSNPGANPYSDPYTKPLPTLCFQPPYNPPGLESGWPGPLRVPAPTFCKRRRRRDTTHATRAELSTDTRRGFDLYPTPGGHGTRAARPSENDGSFPTPKICGGARPGRSLVYERVFGLHLCGSRAGLAEGGAS